jgi:hypothetical protein
MCLLFLSRNIEERNGPGQPCCARPAPRPSWCWLSEGPSSPPWPLAPSLQPPPAPRSSCCRTPSTSGSGHSASARRWPPPSRAARSCGRSHRSCAAAAAEAGPGPMMMMVMMPAAVLAAEGEGDLQPMGAVGAAPARGAVSGVKRRRSAAEREVQARAHARTHNPQWWLAHGQLRPPGWGCDEELVRRVPILYQLHTSIEVQHDNSSTPPTPQHARIRSIQAGCPAEPSLHMESQHTNPMQEDTVHVHPLSLLACVVITSSAVSGLADSRAVEAANVRHAMIACISSASASAATVSCRP